VLEHLHNDVASSKLLRARDPPPIVLPRDAVFDGVAVLEFVEEDVSAGVVPWAEASALRHFVVFCASQQISLGIKVGSGGEHHGQQFAHKTGAVDIISGSVCNRGLCFVLVSTSDVKRQAWIWAPELRSVPPAAAVL
jgi:hypothetical protein